MSFEPLGKVAYSEGAFEGWDKPLFAIAAQFENNDLSGATNLTDLNTTILGGDLVYKYKRLFATLEYYRRERTPETGSKFRSDGFFAEATYLVSSRKNWEVGARYGQYDPTDRIGANLRKEVRGVVSYYYARHVAKIQADFGRTENQAGNGGQGTRNKELRIQTQIVF